MPRRLREKTKNFDRKTDKLKDPRFPSTFSGKVLLDEGQEVNVLIDDISSKGVGTSSMGGFTIIVPRSKAVERMNVKILKVYEKFAIAERREREEKG